MTRSLLIALVLMVAAVLWVASGRFDDEPHAASTVAPPAPEAEAPPTVRVVRMAARPRVAEAILLGRTEPSRAVEVRAETGGRVAEVLAARGAAVAAGDPIVRLRADDRPARLAEARALLAQREIELAAAESLAKEGFQTRIRRAEMEALTEAARASLAAIELELSRTTIAAPFDGIVDARPAELGDMLAVGDAVATVVDLDPLLVVAEVSEREAGSIAPGQAGTARLVTGAEVEGRVRYVERVADPATHTFRVEIEIPNPGDRIPAGLTAEVRFPLATVTAHLVSPAVLTLDDAGVVGVKTVTEDGTVAFHAVTLIADNPEGVWVSGLPDEALVITVGQEYVVPGQRVTPVEAE
jgi:multidrug efflux system membrane fusion protein